MAKISNKIAKADSAPAPLTAPDAEWRLKGELSLNCNCEVFCPCVVSLGAHPPTQGYCQAWLGVRIDKGKFDGESLKGLKVAMMLDIPGRMSEGNWKAALYIDETANDKQAEGLERIFTGNAGGTTGLFRLLVGEYLGSSRTAVTYDTDDQGVRHITAGRAINGSIRPVVQNGDPKKPVVIDNAGYWMGPEIIVSQGVKSKVRDFGRIWTLDGKSAELCHIDWSGPR